jgi:hypothetical protein
VSQTGQLLKQAVQLVVPVSCTNPRTHCAESQFPGPLTSHLMQLLAHGLQNPPVELVETAAEYLGAHELERLRLVE